MGNLIEFIKVARTSDVDEHGWIKVNLLGREVVIFQHANSYSAIELSRNGEPLMQYSMFDKNDLSNTKVKDIIKGLMEGPSGEKWGKLRDHPVRVEGDYLYLGIETPD